MQCMLVCGERGAIHARKAVAIEEMSLKGKDLNGRRRGSQKAKASACGMDDRNINKSKLHNNPVIYHDLLPMKST